MLAPTSHILIIVLLAILLPSALSIPYSIYNLKNRRASHASSGSNSRNFNGYGGRSSSNIDNRGIYSEPQQQQPDAFDQSAYRVSGAVAQEPSYIGNYDTMYDTGADNYYQDDDSVDDRPEREYLYGKPTYRGEYKPTRYYYANEPSYSNYRDHMESTNPLDYLHEEMLQEEHSRQRNRLSDKSASADPTAPQWFQNTDQPRGSTSNIIKNLMLYNNNGMNTDAQQPMDMNKASEAAAAAFSAYDDDEIPDENPYANDLANQNEPYGYFDPLKLQFTNQFNHFGTPSVNKQIYYNQNNRKDADDERFSSKSKSQRKPTALSDNSNEDKDEKDLESLRKEHNKSSWNRKSGSDGGRNSNNDDNMHHSDKNKHNNDDYNGGYDTGFDYEDDEWINWNRKRSLPKESPRPLKALEQQLTQALKFQTDTFKLIDTTTTVPPSSTHTPSSNNDVDSANDEVRKHKGQKEVVLSRPATPLRRHFPVNVLNALSKTAGEMNQSHQTNAEMHEAIKNDGDKHHTNTHTTGTAAAASKKQKRYVSNEATLAQQLNGLKRKIKA